MPKRTRDGSTPHIAAIREMWPVATNDLVVAKEATELIGRVAKSPRCIYRSSHRYAIEMMFTDGIWSKWAEAADGALPVQETGI
jgi:hypothetical protein